MGKSVRGAEHAAPFGFFGGGTIVPPSDLQSSTWLRYSVSAFRGTFLILFFGFMVDSNYLRLELSRYTHLPLLLLRILFSSPMGARRHLAVVFDLVEMI